MFLQDVRDTYKDRNSLARQKTEEVTEAHAGGAWDGRGTGVAHFRPVDHR